MSGIDVPVVSISGHPGSGKTTLIKALGKHFGVPVLFYDDYETITSRPPAEVEAWIARGSNYDEIDLGGLLTALEAAARQRPPFILLDTLLGRAHRATGAAIALSLWLDVPVDVALARKLRQAGEQVGTSPERAVEFAHWIASYSRHYERFISGTYALQRDRVRPLADVVLTRWQSVDAVLAEAVSAIERQRPASVARPNLLTAVGRLGRGFGIERSVKLSASGSSTDRYLLSIHRDDLGADIETTIASIAGVEGLPADKWRLLMQQLPAADVIHFGHEGGDRPVRKVYLEFVTRFHKAMQAGSTQQQELYLALKWRPGEEGKAKLSHYSWSPGRQTATQMLAAIGGHAAGRAMTPSLRAVADVVRLGAARAGDKAMMLIDVAEEDTPRRSIDVNVYSAKLRGRDLRPILAPLLAEYRLPPAERDDMLGRLDGHLIGHVAAGIGDNGQDFTTVYYGLQAQEPQPHV